MLQRSASTWRRVLLGILGSLLASWGSGDTPPVGPEDPTPTSRRDGDTVALDASAQSIAGDASAAPVPVTAEALATLIALRARFAVPLPPAPAEFDDDTDARDAHLAPVTLSPLGVGIASGFEIGPEGLVPHFPSSVSVEARSARVALARKATAPFRIEHEASGMTVEVMLRDGRDIEAEAADGYLVYRHGHAAATVLHRALAEGTEDFLSFDERPEASTVAYRLTLRKGVAGLRLVGNTLEMLDGHGAPRLRVSPPSLITADGVAIDALPR